VSDRRGVEAFAFLAECDAILNDYEQTRDPALLPTIRAVKPRCQSAIDTWLSSLEAAPEDSPVRQVFLTSLAMMYLKLGCAHLYLSETEDARNCFEHARDTGIQTGRSSEVAQAANNLGLIALEQGDMSEAASYFRWAIGRLDAETEREFGSTLRKNLTFVESQGS
jgi:tetratricopeptide (TPR) repeat protein